MTTFILPTLIGVVCIVLGIFNMRGNISTLHSYHRHRVSEEDRIPFGRLVGIGTAIIGVSIIAYGVLSQITVALNNPLFMWIGTGVMIAGLVVGIGLSFFAMIKYNHGIF